MSEDIITEKVQEEPGKPESKELFNFMELRKKLINI